MKRRNFLATIAASNSGGGAKCGVCFGVAVLGGGVGDDALFGGCGLRTWGFGGRGD